MSWIMILQIEFLIVIFINLSNDLIFSSIFKIHRDNANFSDMSKGTQKILDI